MPTMILRAIHPSFSRAALSLLISRPSTLNFKHKDILEALCHKNPPEPSVSSNSPPPPPIFDTPVEAFGMGVKKVQKVIMDERHVLMMNAGVLRRVVELPYYDPRRKALLEIIHVTGRRQVQPQRSCFCPSQSLADKGVLPLILASFWTPSDHGHSGMCA